jgi:hypothetical protein
MKKAITYLYSYKNENRLRLITRFPGQLCSPTKKRWLEMSGITGVSWQGPLAATLLCRNPKLNPQIIPAHFELLVIGECGSYI